MYGAVVDRGRPVIRIALPNRDESLPALIDTGFNGELMISEADARSCGFSVLDDYRSVRLAGDLPQEVKAGSGTILWLNGARRVELLVSQDTHHSRRADDPLALIGTKLLTPNALHIDFEQRTVEISATS